MGFMEKKRMTWLDHNALKKAVDAINTEKIVVGDTDTVPGLFAACTAKGVAQLNAIKERSDKPYLVLLGSREALLSLVKQPLSLQVETLIKHYWPGPLTLVLPAQEDIPEYLQSKQHGIAVRIPEHVYVREWALHCGGLLSTSANFAGKPAPSTLDELDPKIKEMAALELYDSEQMPRDKPSTILDATGSHIRVIREGSIPIKELEVLLGAAFLR